LADFSMQTYCRESAPLIPREWSYEAENLQLYRYKWKKLGSLNTC